MRTHRITGHDTRPRPGLRGPARRRASLVLGFALPLALVAACASTDPDVGGGAGADEDSAEETQDVSEPQITEVAARSPRLAITYDGGIQVLDAATLDVVSDIELAGFNRLNSAGDGQHVFVSTTGGFAVLDLGTWAEPHGDHSHYYTSDPVLTDTVFAADNPGHVVIHEGRTALFDDATGHVAVFDSGDLLDEGLEVREYTTPEAHHGVAVELSDGTLVVSEGNEDARTGIRVLDGDGEEIAASDECPGVHGEAVAADEAVVIGCEDGALIYADGQITKVTSPDDYGRIGNQAGSENSPIVLGDYKSDPDADLERPTRVSLIDTRTGDLELVDLPASYTFRSLARGDDGEALVLGYDGQVHVIDPESGEVVSEIPVIEEWSEPEEWQQPRPTITALDGSIYVTEPATNTIYAVDILTGEVWNSAVLDVTPNEMTGVTGDVVAGVSAEHEHDHGENGHDDGDHAHEDDEDGHGHGDDDDDDHDHDHDDDHDHDHDDDHDHDHDDEDHDHDD